MTTRDDIQTGGRVLVIGRPDRPAGAAVRHLLSRGLPVGLMTGAEPPADAQELQRLGADLVPGSLDRTRDLEAALDGVRSLVLVLDHLDAGPAARLRRGKDIGRAAEAAGLRHVVFAASTGPEHHLVSCDLGTEVERYLRTLDLSLTVLRPATLMEEIPGYWLSRLGDELVLAAPFPPEEHLPMICSDDVGGLVALAVAEPRQFGEMTVPVAGDVVTTADVARSLTEVLGELVSAVEVQVEGVFMVSPTTEELPDVPLLRAVYPGLRTVSSWLHGGGGRELCERAIGRVAA